MPTWLLVLVSLGVSSAAAQDVAPQPPPAVQAVLREIHLDGATIFNRDDVVWLLGLREGAALPKPPAEVAKALQDAYGRDGYTEAKVTSGFEVADRRRGTDRRHRDPRRQRRERGAPDPPARHQAG